MNVEIGMLKTLFHIEFGFEGSSKRRANMGILWRFFWMNVMVIITTSKFDLPFI